ncbi:MAG: hypothetical protein AAF985_26225, partial [Bacteroidota bacterium]
DAHLVQKQSMIVHYEAFIENTAQTVESIANFLDLEADQFDISKIKKGSVGKSKANLSEKEYQGLSDLLRTNLKKLGYNLFDLSN